MPTISRKEEKKGNHWQFLFGVSICETMYYICPKFAQTGQNLKISDAVDLDPMFVCTHLYSILSEVHVSELQFGDRLRVVRLRTAPSKVTLTQ